MPNLAPQVAKKGSECFETLMLRQAQQNGESSTVSNPLRSGVFQQSARDNSYVEQLSKSGFLKELWGAEIR
jgi:hypothetical protein